MTKRRHKYSELSFFPFGNLPSLLSHVTSFATGRAYTKFQEGCNFGDRTICTTYTTSLWEWTQIYNNIMNVR